MSPGDWYPPQPRNNITNYTFGPDLNDSKDFIEIKARLEEIEKRLAILKPNETLQEKFPALQEAYESYKIIEKLVNDQSKQE